MRRQVSKSLGAITKKLVDNGITTVNDEFLYLTIKVKISLNDLLPIVQQFEHYSLPHLCEHYPQQSTYLCRNYG